MAARVRMEEAKKLLGKQVYCLKKDGTMASGKLVRISANGRLFLAQSKGKKVSTKAIIPLVLFDLLAIGTSPYSYGYGYGGGYPGYGGYGGGYGGGFGGGLGGGFGFPFI